MAIRIEAFAILAILLATAACGPSEPAPAEPAEDPPGLSIARAHVHAYAEDPEKHLPGAGAYSWSLEGRGIGHVTVTLRRLSDKVGVELASRSESILADAPVAREVSLLVMDGRFLGSPGRIHAALSCVGSEGSGMRIDQGGLQTIETPHGMGTRWWRTGDPVPPNEDWVMCIIAVEALGPSGTPLPVPITLSGLREHSSVGRILLVLTLRWTPSEE
ncbi:MAG: hypothetical protein ACYS99_02380 [Planctomycetota bacterium]|jgi:hypothetical protein